MKTSCDRSLSHLAFARILRIFWGGTIFGILAWGRAEAGTWTALVHSPPIGVNNCLLLSDGTVFAMNGNGQCARLTPNSQGSYINGTWTTLASMNYGRLFNSCDLLTNGNVYVCGGEYGTGGDYAELYNSQANTWTVIPGPSGVFFSDAASKLLPNGNVLQSDSQSHYYIYNTTSNTLTLGGSCGDMNETCWTRLPNDNVLGLTGYSTTCEHYVWSANAWYSDGNSPVKLFGYGAELGPAFVLPNGNVFQIGGTNNTAIYTPGATVTSAGSWVAGPSMILGGNQLGAVDAPGAMMVDGNILCSLGTVTGFGSQSYFYEYNYLTNSFTQVSAPGGGSTYGTAPFATSMLCLPDGGVLFVGGQNSTSLYEYMPGGAPMAAGQPSISSITENADGSFELTGIGLAGISAGAAYGDDEQMDCNYPLVRMTNSVSGNVYFARTYGWSSTTVQNPDPVTTEFTLPPGLPAGTYSLAVVANGNASTPTTFSYAPPTTPTGLTANSGSNAFVQVQWNASPGATAYNLKQATNSGGFFATVATVTGTSFTNIGLLNGVTYYYEVQAVGSGGAGTNSGTVNATPYGPPPVPNLTAISGLDSRAILSWSSCFGATSYNLKRSLTSGAETTIAAITSTNFTDTNLTDGTTYYYVLSAVGSEGESSNSIEVAVTPMASILLTNTDAINTSSFNAAGNWSNNLAPASNHDYLDSGFALRTPGSSSSYTFAGYSLTMNGGAALALKNDNHTTTIGSSAATGLFLDDASIQSYDAGVTDTIAGYLTLLPGGAFFSPDSGTLTISSVIAGSGILTVTNHGTLVLSGANTYTNGTVVNSSVTLQPSGSGTFGSAAFLAISNSLGVVNLNGISETIGALLGNGGVITNSSTNAVSLTVGTGNSSGVYQGAFVSSSNNPIALTKTGTGTETLAGSTSVSSVRTTGTLNLNGGTLRITTAGSGIVGSGTSIVNLNGVTLIAGADSASFITNLTTATVNAGGVTFDTTNFSITVAQTLVNGGGGVTKLGSGTLTLTKAAGYTGSTVVGAGTFALIEPANMANSSQIAISNNATLNVTGRNDQTLTLNNGVLLSGSGTILGKLSALDGSTINPGDTVGSLIVQSNITLAGGLIMELNRTNAQPNDQLLTLNGTIAAGGTLTVTNLGPALQGGDVFTLFNQPVNGFATINLPAVTGCVLQNNLAVNGSLLIISTNAPALIFGQAGGQFTLSWPADHIGWRLQTQTNGPTVGLSTNWLDVANSTTTNQIMLPFNPAPGSVFFQLVYP